MLTWSPGSLLGGRVLAFGLDSGRIEDPRRGTVLAEVIFQAFDGSIQLVGSDLEIDVHEVCGGEEETAQKFSGCRRWTRLMYIYNNRFQHRVSTQRFAAHIGSLAIFHNSCVVKTYRILVSILHKT